MHTYQADWHPIGIPETIVEDNNEQHVFLSGVH